METFSRDSLYLATKLDLPIQIGRFFSLLAGQIRSVGVSSGIGWQVGWLESH